jgi:hypothetical protein
MGRDGTGSNQYTTRPGAGTRPLPAGLLSQLQADRGSPADIAAQARQEIFERLARGPEPILLWALEQPDLPEKLERQICNQVISTTNDLQVFKRVLERHRRCANEPVAAAAIVRWAAQGYYSPEGLAEMLLGLPRCGPEPIVETVRRRPEAARFLQDHPCWSEQATAKFQQYQQSGKGEWDELAQQHQLSYWNLGTEWSRLPSDVQDRVAACAPLAHLAQLLGTHYMFEQRPQFTQHQLDLIWQRPSRTKATVAKGLIIEQYGEKRAYDVFRQPVPRSYWEDLAQTKDGQQAWAAAVARHDCPAEVLTQILLRAKDQKLRATALQHPQLPKSIRAMYQLVN